MSYCLLCPENTIPHPGSYYLSVSSATKILSLGKDGVGVDTIDFFAFVI